MKVMKPITSKQKSIHLPVEKCPPNPTFVIVLDRIELV
jgi:hypothetical protein